ncbi:MAG: hypothetical protein KKE42_10940 [Alphaproteobacteria bacterium]|uniref:hypothetical protein n=1 Tax=Brevundimonas sp. TaxID=1871086 RepID=UPI0017F78477|nr:hypothetical protein [Brevundimonas sp.]MBU3970624.1 hypothetical protein [Alphaproteobacteria bacterium]MBA3050502.1 hypothetical protein [Brevundimonas sp.]MBU3974299.1 hypothetical protein [Alphaproteobacteria bacterium]MBU4039134.1 hypothetical protein [Alphaproteobacteria bacterium]MBU4135121.1 hypothetical protein [Alphaproteobacteria bacterium]
MDALQRQGASVPTGAVAQLEAASAGSRALDRGLWSLLEFRHDGEPTQCPAYTTSIDAALALAERTTGGAYMLVNDYGGYNRAEINLPGRETHNAVAETMPLAICAAILKAVEAAYPTTKSGSLSQVPGSGALSSQLLGTGLPIRN